jgi:mannose-1-phosphate guanylyltransferase/mannose-6-phosphate isomerase
VAKFVEKPDLQTAVRYVDSGDYYWNSGIFLMRADSWLEEIGKHRPDILDCCRQALEQGTQDSDFMRVSKPAFIACPSDSIDYAVMEKTTRAVVVPISAGWSDVGAWSALWSVCPQDVENIIVVETADAVLVADKDKAQDVKEIVKRLKETDRDEHKFHRRVYRPWGSYEGIDAGPRFQVKRLSVKPGAQLSLQMHHHRAEHWVVVKGTARVTCGDRTFNLHENESTYIPICERHRLENPGNIPLEVIEIQSGSYLGEDDIVRYDDVYDRVRNN